MNFKMDQLKIIKKNLYHMELSDEIYFKIEELSEIGNKLMDEKNYKAALMKFQEAIDLLPAPKNKWEASFWLLTSIGDAYFLMNDYKSALKYFKKAYKLEEGLTNPFLLVRIGQSYYELQDSNNAKEFLLRAYMLAGKDIFKEDEKYFNWLKNSIEL